MDYTYDDKLKHDFDVLYVIKIWPEDLISFHPVMHIFSNKNLALVNRFSGHKRRIYC